VNKKAAEHVLEQEQLPIAPSEPVSSLATIERGGTLQQPSVLEIFSALARDKSIEVSRIRELMEMQERAEKRQAEKEFIAAMNRLQPKLPRIGKDGSIDLGKGKPLKFARYETIDAAIRPLLTQEGFSISFGTATHDKGITITATLSHSAGHSRTESMPLPFDTGPGRNSIQAVGSTISYGRRYLVCAMLNLVTVGEDTDGVGIEFLDEQQVNNIIDMFAAAEMGPDSQSKFLTFMHAERVGEIHKRDYEKAVTALNAKIRKRQESM